MTKLYFIEIDPHKKHYSIAPFLPLFSTEEQTRIMRFRDVLDSYRCLMGRLLLVQSFKDFNIERRDLRDLRYTSYKRPFMDHMEHLSFSISHSGAVVVLAVSDDQALGIDVEEVIPKDLSDCDQYLSMIHAHGRWDENKTLSQFYTIWTQNEAALKAHGTGFLTTLEVVVSHDQALIEGKSWYLREVAITPAYCCHLASSRNGYVLDTLRVFESDLNRWLNKN